MAALSCAAAYLLLTLVVFLHPANRVDRYLENLFRPDDVWGDLQLRADYVVEGIQPAFGAVVLFGAAAMFAIRRKSIWPLVFSLALGLVAIVSSAITKIVIARPDPHDTVSSYSYPSGHTLTVLICSGAIVLMSTSRTRWWGWCPVGVITALMAYSLLVQAAHWATDILGSLLLGAALLLAASTTTWRYHAVDGRRPGADSCGERGPQAAQGPANRPLDRSHHALRDQW